MKLKRWLVSLVLLSALTLNAYAGRDPIGWSQSGSVPATTQLNHSYSVNFTITNNLPFIMATRLDVANNSSPLSEVNMVDSCSGLRLTAGQACSVGLVLIPKTAGTKNLSIFMEYGNNKVQIPVSVISTNTLAAGSSILQGDVLIGFPSAILSSTTYPLKFTFTNNGSTTLSNLVLAQKSGNTAGFAQGSTTNCTSLSPGAQCVITGSFITSATSGVASVGYTLASGSTSGEVTTSTIINNSIGKGVRTFTLINNCTQDIWFGAVSANINGNGCKSNSDCTYPSICNTGANSGAGYCFYPAPAPVNGVYQITANGGTNTALIPDYGFPFVWSGNMAGRTVCTGAGCQTADCGGGTGACPAGSGFNQPATLAEFTLQRSTVDNYDISILNGTNVGIQTTPTTNFSFANGFSPSEYNCGSPGKVVQTNGLGGCSWIFDPTASPTPAPAYRYRYVTATSNAGCNDSTVCPGGTVCGLFYDRSGSPTTLNSYCGTLLGYDTPNQVCSFKNTSLTIPTVASNPGDVYFNCDTASGVTSNGNINNTTGNFPTGTAYTNWGLLACVAQPNMDLATCFNTALNPPPSTTNGCGCVNWSSYGSGIVVPSDTLPCITNNTIWSSNVLPGIVFMKKACPTAYSWPFDDKSSLFGCDDISGSHTTNSVNYTVTFCPA